MNKNSGTHLHAGEALGHYQLIRPLDQRGTIELWQAQHINVHVQVALKILPLHDLPREMYLYYEMRLRHEAQFLAEFHHPHIVGFRDYIVWRHFFAVVMQYAPNGSVAHYHPAGRKLPLSLIRLYTWQIGSALYALHLRGLLHRDVKPGNILLLTPRHALLADFGLVVCDPSLGYRRKPYYKEGTAAYMAPEQYHGYPCPASDQYGLATGVYEWLARHPPFAGDPAQMMRRRERFEVLPVRNIRPELPAAVDEILRIALNPDPTRRYPSVLDFARTFVDVTRTVRPPLVHNMPYYQGSRLSDTAELDAVLPMTPQPAPRTGEQQAVPCLSAASHPHECQLDKS